MIKAIIIDDEVRAINTLQKLLEEYAPEVQIMATARNVPEGVLAINAHQPDLVFLDVQMPEYNGLELLKFFKQIDFEIIFVTAYNQYALKAFEISAVDYLMKPLEINKLTLAIEKFKSRVQSKELLESYQVLKENIQYNAVKRLALPTMEGMVFIEIFDIICLEAEGAYTMIKLKDGTQKMVSKGLKHFEQLLEDQPLFFRTHRSTIVNINFIERYLKGEGTLILEGKNTVNVSRDLKQNFEQRLKLLKIAH